ncbi:MAG: NADH-quinone oxidoreductase subunit M [Candidatus Sericytochromatia bacterium]|nr:NADH-quinone oxidoreductase subunit M [Candidatus Tanganyikabacteria bacterium]
MIMTTHLLSWLVFWPLLAGLLVFGLSERRARHWALVASLAELMLATVMIADFQPTPEWQYEERWSWLVPLGLTVHLAVDGISAYLVLGVAILGPLAILASWRRDVGKAFFYWLLAFEGGMIGALCSLDLLVFYVFWEIMLLPAFFLTGIWGGEHRIRATVKFAIMTLVGSLTMLLAILYVGVRIHAATGAWSFDLGQALALSYTADEEMLLFWAFMAAFAVKIPLFPLHIWLPGAYTEAPTGAVLLMSGMMAKLGAYGMVRFAIPLFPHAGVGSAEFLAFLAVVGIVYGAIIALGQPDAKRLVAYSSFSHLGWITLGLLSFDMEGLTGSVYQMLAHAVGTGALFLIVGMLWDRAGSTAIEKFGGWAATAPYLATCLLIVALGSIGLPGLAGFVGEFMILLGAWGAWPWTAIVGGTGVVLGAGYMLLLVQRTLFGPAPGAPVSDLSWREALIILPLVGLTIGMGVYPGPVLERIAPSARNFLNLVEARRDTGSGAIPAGGGVSRPARITR